MEYGGDGRRSLFFLFLHRTKPFLIASPNVPNDGSNYIRRIIYCDWLMLSRLLASRTDVLVGTGSQPIYSETLLIDFVV